MARASTSFKPGQSGNPSGRPKIAQELRKRAIKAVEDWVIEAWIDEVRNQGKNWVKCSELLANYGLGKPPQPITGEDGGPVEFAARVVIELPDNGRDKG